MACPNCGVDNLPGFRFCGQCATPLGPEVKVEGAEPHRNPRSYTPKHLAEKILTSRSALEGERKQLTVLFADVQGSVALSESVDPETLHRIMDRFFVILADGVHRFEGTVNQYTGDGIMALFGAPIAHEDHARRACYAALHLTDELRRYADELRRTQGLNFVVRMGLNSGEVVVGKIGDDLRMDYTARGHTVGLAARMEQVAEPGRVYLAEDTATLVSGFFRLRDLGPFDIKGTREAVRVFELQGLGALRTRLDVSRARGFSKFVGRANETAALEAALERAIQGNGQVIGVVGEAGVGKSRLCYEFVQGCRARGLMVNEAHGVAHGKAIPFLTVLEFFRGYFGITDQDADEMARDKIAGRLLRLDEHFSEALPLLFDFLGVPDPARPVPRMDPEARQRQLFGMTRRLVHARSQRAPAVTLLEDLHWIDGGTAAFVETLVEALPGTRTLVLVNYRPEYRASWMERSYYQQLPLVPLGPEAITELLRDLLGADPSLAGLVNRIRERTGGNPFFIEEVVQSLTEAGSLQGSSGAYRLAKPVDELAIPASVQAVLAARIDRLGEREKQVLQTASVIGRNFSEPILKGVAELRETELAASLSSLQRAEFIYEEALYPEAIYAFKHALTQEVAYRSQLTERRARVHAAAAQTIAELYPDRLDEQAALLAHHLEEAGEALEAARWHARAAQWVGLSDLAETVRHWRQVRSLLERLPESADTCVLGMAACGGLLLGGWRMGMPEDEVEAVFTKGRKLARQSGDLRTECVIVAVYASVRGTAGDVNQFVDGSLEAARLAERSGDPGVILAVAMPLAYSHFSAGRLNEAWGFVRRALDSPPEDPRLGSEIGGLCPYAWLETVGRSIAVFMGSIESGKVAQQQGIEIARHLGDLESLGWGCGFAAYLAEFSGETKGCLERCREGFEIAERIGSAYSRAYASGRLGVAHLVRKEWAEAIELFEAALELARQHRTGLDAEALWLSYLAEAQLSLGRMDAAHETANQAIAIAQQRGTLGYEIPAQLARARVLRQSRGGDAGGEINTALVRAESLIEETGARSYRPFVYEERAELARLLGDGMAHNREIREAHRLFTEMGATGHAERLAKELGL
jgi:class 3 adenylate cyclase/tetratricopeptide (TPR) repeat protein